MLPNPLIIPSGPPQRSAPELQQASEREPAPEGKKKRPFWRKAVNVFAYIVIIGGITFGLPKALAWALDTPYPMATITSGSMWPALKEGDLVFIQGIKSKSDMSIGDVVVYRNKENGTFVIHRVVAMGEKTFTTKGDANFSKDDPVRYEDAVGKAYELGGYYARIPYLGIITVYASKQLNHQP